MKHWRGHVALGLGLVLLSAVLYWVHYLIFDDPHHVFIYLVGDIAFVPIEVLLVTLVLHQLLQRREKHAMLRKLNMVVGAFFSEVGTALLRAFAGFDRGLDDCRDSLMVSGAWSARDYAAARRRLAGREHAIDPSAADLAALRTMLLARRDFLLGLLENPNVLEHEAFTDLLWAVFHLTEELDARGDLAELPASDLKHLAGDIRRAYGRLTGVWLSYMAHLHRDYPYLFSLATRMHPFVSDASPVVV